MSYLDQLIAQSGLTLAPAPPRPVEAGPNLEVEAEQVLIPAGTPEPVVAKAVVQEMTVPLPVATPPSERAPIHTQINSVEEYAAEVLRASSTALVPAPPAEIVIGVREIERIVPAPPRVDVEMTATAPAPVPAITPLSESRAVDHSREEAAAPGETADAPTNVPARRPTILDVRRWVAAPLSVEEVEQPSDGADDEGALVRDVIASKPTTGPRQLPSLHSITVEPPAAHVELSIGTVHVTIEGTLPQPTAPIAATSVPAPAIELAPAWSRLARRYVRA